MRKDAILIYQAGLEAVSPAVAVHRRCRCSDDRFDAADRRFDLRNIEHIFVVGAETVLRIDRKASEKDLIVCLISGGRSALLPAPASGIDLADKQKTIEALLACGASIQEINAIRKHISAIKAGQLAKIAAPAHLISLILSDVVGDRADVVASGPTAPDPTTFSDCLRIVEKYEIAPRLKAPQKRRCRKPPNRGSPASAAPTIKSSAATLWRWRAPKQTLAIIR